ncbi:MAG: hypothetical protein GEU99_01100 [Luteitalea sp.]|nr:hypothetical protein [Luteitalea sp.]
MVVTGRIVGVLLVLLGLIGYVATGRQSVTALIPAAFGALLWVLALLARNERRRPHAMHAAALVGLLGFLATVRALFSLPALLQGEALARPAAVMSQSVMALLTGVFVALCVRSFIDARRRRQSSGT